SARAGGRPAAACDVEVRLALPATRTPLRAGTEVRVRGEWVQGTRPVIRGAWPEDPTYAGFVSASSPVVLAPSSGVAHPLLAARGAMEARIHRLFGRQGPLADALLLGRRETLDPALRQSFAASGLVHLLAISGAHVALIGAILLLAARACRLSHRAASWAAIGMVAVYLAVIGAPPSAVRAGIMLALALLARILQRPSAPMASVSAAALAILAVDPMAALDAGFQLSFAGVLGISLLRGAMLKQVPAAWRAGKWRRPLVESMVVSVAAFLATAPIVAFHFGQVAPVSIVANLPAIPLTSLALIGIVVSLVLEPLFPPLARLVADGAGLAMDGLTRVVDAAAAMPYGHAAVDPPPWPLWAAAAVAFLVALDLAGGLQKRVRWALAAGFASLAWLALPGFAPAGGGGLELDFIDVGQGDAVALRTPAGRWMLVDAGPRDERFDAGEKRVLPFLRARGAERLEAIVLTHPHADHIGGAAAVLRAMPVGRLIEPGLATGNPEYVQTLEAAARHGVRWTAARQDAVMRLDGVELDFLWPRPALLDGNPDANEISAVIRVRYAGFTALLTGDAEAPAEHEMVARYGGALHAELLKSGHHGSHTSSTEEFVDAVRPELAVISVGRRNRYGHPNEDVLERYARHHVRVARTDRDGTVTVRVAPDGSWARAQP
ncbi:MAG: internalization-related competence protein ComEC/Rec2, partial [Gemmatimonadetes bacterium]|nr:internalization-related competence protein ComEC/Rec2 [Gemmatimonadota bacterium]